MRIKFQKKFLLAGLFLTLLVLCTNTATSSLVGLEQVGYIEGVASWYADFSPGIKTTTANMEIFDHDKLTCAIWDYPFNTILEVTNIENGKKVRVRVNDRGPAKRLCRKGRVIDLTKGSFEKIADLNKGLIKVRVKPV